MTLLTRRRFLGVLTAVPFVGRFVAPRTYGFVDVERSLAEGWHPATVLLDGVEVDQCVRFNDREGWVDAHVLDAEGRAQWDGLDGVLTERRYGRITFIPNTSYK